MLRAIVFDARGQPKERARPARQAIACLASLGDRGFYGVTFS